MYKRIFVPVDGSETAERGLSEATRLAKTLDAKLKIAHIVDDSPLTLNPEAGMATAPLVADFAAGGKQILEEARAHAATSGIDAEVVLHENFTGRVADLIIEEASKWGADLVVMGTHGRSGLRHAVLGSTAEAVVHGSNVPVLLVRVPGSR